MSDLRGNIDRLLQDLEDAVFIFNREQPPGVRLGLGEKFLGRERAACPANRSRDIFPPSTTLGLLIAQAAQTGRPIRNRRVPLAAGRATAEPGGRCCSRWTCCEAARRAGRTGMLVRLRDPEAQRKIGRELQTADRLAAISRVSGGVAHEVKNPLNAILLHVEVARAQAGARRHRRSAADGDHLARDPAAGPRGEDVPGFHAPGGTELSRGSAAAKWLAEIVELARPQADAAKIQHGGDAARPKASRCGWIATCSSRRCSTWW